MKFNIRYSIKSFLCIVIISCFSLTSSAYGQTGEIKEELESETGFYYTIKKGDTLWDLSQHFNNSPWLWPELWEENDQIPNPHWIYPGERIRLYKKSGMNQFTEQKRVESGSEMVVLAKTEEPDAKTSGFYFLYPPINRIGFIKKDPVAPAGTVFKVKDNKLMVSTGDHIYVQPTETTLAMPLLPGSQWTIFRYLDPTNEKKSRETIGTQHFLVGIVEIISKEQEFVIAKVVKSYRDIKTNDFLMPFIPRPQKINLQESAKGIDGRIISSEEHLALMGEDMIAFIDKGKKDGIKTGQQYSIYYQDKHPVDKKGKKHIVLTPVDIGSLIVLHIESTTSTVLITDSSRKIKPGEKIKTP